MGKLSKFQRIKCLAPRGVPSEHRESGSADSNPEPQFFVEEPRIALYGNLQLSSFEPIVGVGTPALAILQSFGKLASRSKFCIFDQAGPGKLGIGTDGTPAASAR